MAIPAFQKVRTASQEKAVLNNLRQLAAASDQYYLENNVTTVRLDQLIGPDKYIRMLNPVAGEDYSEVVLKQGEPLVVHLPDGREVRYPLGAEAKPQARSVQPGAVKALALSTTDASRIKVQRESDQQVLFNGKLLPDEPKIFEFTGVLLITVEKGSVLRMQVDGKSYPVPVEGYGRFRVD
jgi:hypothetical protein